MNITNDKSTCSYSDFTFSLLQISTWFLQKKQWVVKNHRSYVCNVNSFWRDCARSLLFTVILLVVRARKYSRPSKNLPTLLSWLILKMEMECNELTIWSDIGQRKDKSWVTWWSLYNAAERWAKQQPPLLVKPERAVSHGQQLPNIPFSKP